MKLSDLSCPGLSRASNDELPSRYVLHMTFLRNRIMDCRIKSGNDPKM
jgi:hypothetical protein